MFGVGLIRKRDATLAILIVGFLLSAGALLWYKLVLPFGRVLQQSEENDRPEFAPIAASAVQAPEFAAADASLVNLSNAVGRPRVASTVRVEDQSSTRAVAPVA